MNEPARTVLLTGASGFIGRPTLAALLARGFRVHAVSRNAVPPDETDVMWHQADLLDPAQRRRLVEETHATHLVHLAWHVEHDRFWTAPENADWVAASLDLFRLFAGAGGRRAVFAGSCAEYDWAKLGDKPVHETDPCRPASVYGRAKLTLLQQTSELAARANVSLTWARFFLLFGFDEEPRRLIPSIVRGLLRNEDVPLTSGRQIRDFLDTRDVAHALSLLTGQDAVAGTINVASGRALSIRALADQIARQCGRTSALLKFGALPDREGEPAYLVANVARLSDEAAFAPQASLESRLSQIIERHRRYLSLL